MPSRPFKIGVTGGIGSGKTVVCNIFHAVGVPIYSADSRAKYLMINNHQVKESIRNSFGNEAYFDNGTLNTRFLSKTVFKNQDQLKILNNIVHPAVANDFELWVSQQAEESYVIKEAALLVESGSYKSLDYLINVIAPTDLRIERVLNRDTHRSRQDIVNIISNQLNDSEINEKSAFVINNDGRSLLIPQVLKIHNYFIS